MNSCSGKSSKKKAPMRKAMGGGVSGPMPMRQDYKRSGKWPGGSGGGDCKPSKKCR